MSSLDRKQLEQKEKQLRKELNEASEEFENQLSKAIGFAVVGGLLSYGLYKLITPGKKSKAKKTAKKDNTDKERMKTFSEQSSSVSVLSRVANAVVPILISKIGSQIIKDDEKD